MATAQEDTAIFETLPTASPVNMLRFLSDEPNSTYWATQMRHDVMLSVAQEGNPLEQFAKKEVTDCPMLIAPSRCSKSEICGNWNWKALTPTSSTFLCSWQCNRPEELKIGFRSGRSASAAITEALENFGPGLKRLVLCADLSCKEKLNRIFESAGGSLESLELRNIARERDMNLYMFQVKTLARSCPLVTDLRIKWCGDETPQREAEMSSYELYGTQLQRVKLGGDEFSEKFLRELESNCPNASVDVSEAYSCGGGKVAILGILGESISHIELSPNEVTSTPAFAAAASKLCNLEWLHCGTGIVQAVFREANDDIAAAKPQR